MERQAALADFEAARREWEAAFGEVPDAALRYLKPGDDYALGGLQVHVNWVLVHYLRVLYALMAGGFAPVAPQDPPGEEEEARAGARRGLAAMDRRKELEAMSRLHSTVVDACRALPASDWSREVSVVYGQGEEPHPTSPADLVIWLADHYREHVQQSADLIEEWKAAGAPT
jgi:hypothetical protein